MVSFFNLRPYTNITWKKKVSWDPRKVFFSQLLRSFSDAQMSIFFSTPHENNDQTPKLPASSFQNLWIISWVAGCSYVCPKCLSKTKFAQRGVRQCRRLRCCASNGFLLHFAYWFSCCSVSWCFCSCHLARKWGEGSSDAIAAMHHVPVAEGVCLHSAGKRRRA